MSGAWRCCICQRPREDWPQRVRMRNGFLVESCQWCWMKWPDAWKEFPELGFGRWVDDILRGTA